MKEIDDGPSHALDRFREYSPLRVGIEQEIVAVSDFNCSSSAANNTCTPTPIEPTAKPTINRSEPHNLKKGPKRGPLSYPNDPSPHSVWFFTAENSIINHKHGAKRTRQ